MDLSTLKQELGDTLLTKEGEVPIEKALEGKNTICLYFSAHWCPPCRAFTPVLSEVYNNEKSDNVEVVFISSDRDEASFNEYYGEMPWCALPFKKDDDKKRALSGKYGIRGIPTLVILKKDGTEDREGRNYVTSNKNLQFD